MRAAGNPIMRLKGQTVLITGAGCNTGLGIDINEAAIARHPYQPTALRHYRGNLVDVRPGDAVSYFPGGSPEA